MLNKDLMSFDEAREYLMVSESLLRKLCFRKEITYYKPTGKVYFKKNDLDNYIMKGKVSTIGATENG